MLKNCISRKLYYGEWKGYGFSKWTHYLLTLQREIECPIPILTFYFFARKCISNFQTLCKYFFTSNFILYEISLSLYIYSIYEIVQSQLVCCIVLNSKKESPISITEILKQPVIRMGKSVHWSRSRHAFSFTLELAGPVEGKFQFQYKKYSINIF